MKIQVSAPGKIILHGEHAVVYGKTAVAVSLSLKTTATLVSTNEKKVSLCLKNIGMKKEWDLNVFADFLDLDAGGEIRRMNAGITARLTNIFGLSSYSEPEKLATMSFLYLWIYISKSYNSRLFVPCCVEVDSELSIGSGMGSSASYSVCLATALLIHCGRLTPSLLPEDKKLINKWAFESEKIFHGNPSGIDNTICTYGGALLYRDGKVTDILTKIPNISILLVNTKIPRNTRLLVDEVREKLLKFPHVIEPILLSIDNISNECWKILQNTNNPTADLDVLKNLQVLVNVNQNLLNALGVGHVKLDQIQDIAFKHGYSSKLTGAGGGGCAFIILSSGKDTRPEINLLKQELLSCNFEVFDVFLGSPGAEVQLQGSQAIVTSNDHFMNALFNSE